MPFRNMSSKDENKLLKCAVEDCMNNILTFEESCLFLTTWTNTKQRLIRVECLLKRNFSDRIVINVEGSHRKLSEKLSNIILDAPISRTQIFYNFLLMAKK